MSDIRIEDIEEIIYNAKHEWECNKNNFFQIILNQINTFQNIDAKFVIRLTKATVDLLEYNND